MSKRWLAVACALASAAACARGARPSAPRPPPPPREPADAGPADAGDAGDALPSLDALAERAPRAMREVARSDDATQPIVVTADADACFRAIVAATRPVHARFEDRARAARGAALSGDEGLVPPEGPACARKGESLRLVVEGRAEARAVVWRAE